MEVSFHNTTFINFFNKRSEHLNDDLDLFKLC